MSPFFSIIIPTYNRSAYLPKTIQSVIDQSFTDWECLVIDDGSTDNTEDVVKEFNEPRIKYFWKENEERSIARNYGIARAKGMFVCFLDSDDYYKSDHLQVLYKYILGKQKEAALYYTGMEKNADGNTTPLPVYDPDKYPHPVNFILEHFLFINSVCVHRDVFQKYRFPENFYVWEDTHLWLRVVANYPFYQISEITTGWNLHENSSVSQSFSKVTMDKLKMYLDCISDLQQNHTNELNGLLSEKEITTYKFDKYRLLMKTAWMNGQYSTFREGIKVGKKYFKTQQINRCILNCLLTSNRAYRISKKTVRKII